MNFLKTFTRYDVVVIADDNGARHPGCVQVSDAACAAAGFSDMNFTIGKKVSGWEKALFYLSQKNYERVWFLEEDVFVQDEAALLAMDRKYAGDLLCNTISANAGDKTDWHWPLIQIRTPPPYFCAMCCAVRVSRRLLQRIAAYARVYKTLFFLEALFPTLCAGLVAQSPPELANITYRNEFDQVDRRFLYHPVKQLEKHVEFRKKCNGF